MTPATQAMTKEEWETETLCATCGRPLANTSSRRNINGRLVHTSCPKKR